MSKEMILSLGEADDVLLVGGKALSLGQMIRAGFNVPEGFVITTNAFSAGMSEDLKQEIINSFNKLGAQRVAVRSSGIAEDSESASWAGQLESYLNITKSDIIDAIEKCWQSVESKRATHYATRHKAGKDQHAVAVVVQAMVDSNISGVTFTVNPISGNCDELMIEAIYGLGELLVQGIATPESVVVGKTSGRIISHSPHRQKKKLIYKSGKNVELVIEPKLQNRNVLTAAQTKELYRLAIKIELYYGSPQDVEWAIANGKICVLQSRPITTL